MKLLFSTFTFIVLIQFAYTQNNTYRFSYNSVQYNYQKLFTQLEKDLGYKIEYKKKTNHYSYIQHLKNQSIYNELYSKANHFNNKGISDSLLIVSNQLKEQFSNQHVGFYYLAKYYLDERQTKKAVNVLKKASIKHKHNPQKFEYLTTLYKDNSEFFKRFKILCNQYDLTYQKSKADSSIISFMDSIKYRDQVDRGAYYLETSNPRYIKQVERDSLNASELKKFVLDKGWVSKYLGPDYDMVYVPVMHFSSPQKLFFLDYIITDCEKFDANWVEAEFVTWKIAIHNSELKKDETYYNAIPLVYLDSDTGLIDIQNSLLGIIASVNAFNNNRMPITIITTSKHPNINTLKNLEIIKSYFVALGIKESNIIIQEEVLNPSIEKEMSYVPLFVVKR